MDDVPLVNKVTRDQVLRAAVDLADAQGLAAVTMRALGGTLDVEAMTLYNHVENKADLLGGMLDLVVGRVDLPDDAGAWRPAVREQCVRTHDALLAHRWSAPLWVASRRPGPAQLRWMEVLLRRLRSGGLGPSLLDQAFHTLVNHTVGHAMQSVESGLDREQVLSGGAAFLAGLDVQAFPELAAHVRWHLERPVEPAPDDAFEFGLDLVLDGLDRVRASA